MAKKEIDPKISALIKLKGMISNLKAHSLVIVFDDISNLIYMATPGEIGECFGIISDPELFLASKELHGFIINTPDVVGFNKALKKTITKVDKNDDKSLTFTTNGYPNVLTLPYLEDYTSFTNNYYVLFKNKEITKNCLNAIYGNSTEWTFVKDSDIERLKNNELVIIVSNTSNQMFMSKSIFGGLKKTKSLSYTVIQIDDDSELVLFRLEEDGYFIYKLIRYLTNL